MKQKLRILFVSSEYPPETGGGGIGSSVASIGPGLSARSHEVHVLSCSHLQAHRDYMDNGVHIHRRGILPAPLFYAFKLLPWPESVARVRSGAAAYYWYRRLSRQYKFDVVEYADWHAEGLFLSLLKRHGTGAHLHTPLLVLAKYGERPLTRDLRLAA
ncbi:MAG: glycosyltransferase, partial [Terriglobales bacterium]